MEQSKYIAAFKSAGTVLFLCLAASVLTSWGCGNVHAQGDAAAAGLPPAPKVVPFPDAALFAVDHPEQFPLATAAESKAASQLAVTGTVVPDPSAQVPVPSLATGRIVEVDTRLGDEVKKGQLLFKVRSSDIAGAYAGYLQAVKAEQLAADNERLTTLQLNRAKLLFEDGAYPKSNLEIAENAELGAQIAQANAKIVTNTAREQLTLMGVDPDHPSGIVSYYAPVAGTITDQQITKDAAVQSYAMPAPFTISDLSKVWVVCDVYENDLASVGVGDAADVALNAFPGRTLKGRVSNMLPILDPTIRTGKVRIEVQNPGFMKLGMFATAVFHGQRIETHTIVPASAILHVHDRDFVFVPASKNQFRRVQVVGGDLVANNSSLQEVRSGISPGQQVISNALILDQVLSLKE